MSLPDPAIKLKLCKVCNLTKPVTDFPHWRAKCKECLKVINREQRREINARYYARRKELANRQIQIEDGQDTDSEASEHKSPIPHRGFEDPDSEQESDLDDMGFLAPPDPVTAERAQVEMNLNIAHNAHIQIVTLLETLVIESRQTNQLLERFLRL